MTQSSRPQAGNKNPIYGNPAYIDAGPWSRNEWAERMYAIYTGDENTLNERTQLRGVLPTFDDMLVVDIIGIAAEPVGVQTGAGFAGGSILFNSAEVRFNPVLPGIAARTDKVVIVENNTNVAYDGTPSGVVLYFPTDLTDYSGASSIPPYSARLAILAGNAATGNPTNLVQSTDYWMVELARYTINLGVYGTLVDNREFINIETVVGIASAENDTVKDAQILGAEVNDDVPATGFGVGTLFRLENDGGNTADAARRVVAWLDETDGAEDAQWLLYLSAGGALNLAVVINAPAAASVDGNARGVGAVDLQQVRNAITQVASGVAAFLCGRRSTASGDYSHAEGNTNVASGEASHAEGESSTASNDQAHAEGYATTASGLGSHAEGGVTVASGGYAHAEGGSSEASGTNAHAEGQETLASGTYTHAGGYRSIAGRDREFSRSGGRFAANGDAQYSDDHLRRVVTHSDANWYELFLNGATTQITIAADQVVTFDCLLVGTTQGCTKSFAFRIVGIIENDGGTTTLLASTVTTIYDADDTDFDARATADDANDALLIEVTDSTSGGDVVRWSAVVRLAEVTFPA